MLMLQVNSLSRTLDALAETRFFGRRLAATDRAAAVRWICGRQGLPGAYAGMFAPTDADWRGIRLFTGERVLSRAGIGHQLGEEACRVLTGLGPRGAEDSAALQRAIAGMTAQLGRTEDRGQSTVVYCCGSCSTAYWRNLALGLFPHAEARLSAGMSALKTCRTSDGQWRRFPFFFTCLALTEVDPSLARSELEHAARRWERVLPRLARSKNKYAQRRAEIGRRVLARCDG